MIMINLYEAAFMLIFKQVTIIMEWNIIIKLDYT